MLFNSPEFLFFFVAVTTAYFLVPLGQRIWLLLAASCLFYMVAIPVYILILVAVILVDYFAAFQIADSRGARRRAWLGASIAANVGLLAVFKYYNFAETNLEHLARFVGWNYSLPLLRLALPIGLSFHTFQAMSYTIEVYRGNLNPERSLPHYALYVLFYPQLVAGPIERPQNLLPQFRICHDFNYERVADGLRLMAWGLFKKMVVADRLAPAVNAVYASPGSANGPAAIIATVLFAFQIYCDFSGYSDIAIGAARVMGFRLMTNFRRPYLAESIGEFWSRWHISLSTWFRDYLYFPLGGNRRGTIWTAVNLMVVFLVSGLWHGANWTFVLWGAFHGACRVGELAAERTKLSVLGGMPGAAILRRLAVFALVCFGWIFFRAPDVATAWQLLSAMTHGWTAGTANIGVMATLAALHVSAGEFLIAVISVTVLFAVDAWYERADDRLRNFALRPAWARWVTYYAFAVAVLVLGVFSRTSFIYFQF